MNPIQSTALIIVVIATGVLVARAIRKAERAEREFLRDLVEAVAGILVGKGYMLGPVDPPPLPLLPLYRHLARFEKGTDALELSWDGRDQEVNLIRRVPPEVNMFRLETLARVQAPRGTTKSAYDDAKAAFIEQTRALLPLADV
jgi:hypothetical protein